MFDELGREDCSKEWTPPRSTLTRIGHEVWSGLSFLQHHDLFFNRCRRNTFNTKSLSHKSPKPLFTFSTSLLLKSPPRVLKTRPISTPELSRALLCADRAMSPPAMAPIVGSGATTYKRESGTARLLGSGTKGPPMQRTSQF
jgi:hypothetical protein